MLTFTQGSRCLPALKGFKIPAEHTNKTQGQGIYDRMNNRATKAIGTNVAFRGLALDPYLSFSLRSSLLYFSQCSPTISCFTDSCEVEGQLRWTHTVGGPLFAVENKHFYKSQSNVETRRESQRYLGRNRGLTQHFFQMHFVSGYQK